MNVSFLTLDDAYTAVAEFVDRRSRFIAQIVHVESERAAEQFVDEVRARHHDARHHVVAWLLADGRARCSDDGEPHGTGGIPTLDVLRGADLANICCVVTRYFGGTLLGPGGLSRAYAAATRLAIEQAQTDGALIEMTCVTPLTCVIPYAAYDRVVYLVHMHGGHIRDTIFTEDVQLSCVFRQGDEGQFVHALRELAAGEDLCRVGEPRFERF